MAKQPTKIYRYRQFSASTIEALCHDELYFSDPAAFNDPLDCNPHIESDSTNEELILILSELLIKKVYSESSELLKKSRIIGQNAEKHANRLASNEVSNILKNISYDASNPDYDCKEEAENWLLTTKIKEELLKRYEKGICCFSSTFNNPLLWSHYGDEHRGICLGFDLRRTPAPQLHKVIYGGERMITTSLIEKAVMDEDSAAIKKLDQNILLRKALAWSYEKEWRLIGDQGVQPSPVRLVEVTFGLRCSTAIQFVIINFLRNRRDGKNLKFYEMHQVSGSFKLKRRLVNEPEMNCFLPNVAQSEAELHAEFSEVFKS